MSNQVQKNVVTVAAGDAANATSYYYIRMKHFDVLGLQIEWTAGSAGGTITISLEASLQDAVSSTLAASLSYQDVTAQVFGVASFTGDTIAIDQNAKLSGVEWLRVKVTVALIDGDTEYTIDSTKTVMGK